MKTSFLWEKLLDSGQTEEGLLYDVLHKMVVCEKLDNFPPRSSGTARCIVTEQILLITDVHQFVFTERKAV